jgi:hypothetical protein
MDLSADVAIPPLWRRLRRSGARWLWGVSAALLLTACAHLSTEPPGQPSTDNHLLRTCPPFTATDHPTRIFVIKLTGRFDPRALHPIITESVVTEPPWTTGNPKGPPLTQIPPAWTPKTPLDLDLNVVIGERPELYGKREKVLIRIVVEDTSVSFRSDGYAIAAGDHNARELFCQFPGGFQEHEATAMTYYFTRKPGAADIYSRYNVGLTLPHTDKSRVVPIILDPSVKNTG